MKLLIVGQSTEVDRSISRGSYVRQNLPDHYAPDYDGAEQRVASAMHGDDFVVHRIILLGA
jgi:hypothetical protein